MPTPIKGSVDEAQGRLKNLLGGSLETETTEEDNETVVEETDVVVADESLDDTTVETSEDDTTTETEVTAESSEEDEGDEVQTLNELAEVIDVDLETLYKLKIPATDPRGQRTEVSIGEVKDKLQDFLRVQEERQAFEIQRQTFETERQQAEQILVQRLQEADQFLSAFETQLNAEEQQIDWNSLRTNNPAEYSALKAEFADRKEALRQHRTQMTAKASQAQEQAFLEQKQAMEQRLLQEHKLLLQALPEWTDEKKASTEREQLKSYLKSEGFSDQDIGTAADHRLIVMARKAMLFDQGTKKADVAKKKVKSLPKRVKPTSNSKSKVDVETEKQKKMRRSLRKTGKVQDAAALLKSRLDFTRTV